MGLSGFSHSIDIQAQARCNSKNLALRRSAFARA
jgi:hypothetical protein